MKYKLTLPDKSRAVTHCPKHDVKLLRNLNGGAKWEKFLKFQCNFLQSEENPVRILELLMVI